MDFPPNFRGIISRTFTEVIVKEGKGTEEDIVREVHYFLDENKKLIFTIDPCRKVEE